MSECKEEENKQIKKEPDDVLVEEEAICAKQESFEFIECKSEPMTNLEAHCNTDKLQTVNNSQIPVTYGLLLFPCKKCHKLFMELPQLQSHLNTHEDEAKKSEFPCKMCALQLPDEHALNIHMSTHSAEKTHMCNSCGKKLATKQNLERHMRLHTGSKWLRCNKCFKKFSIRESYEFHILKHASLCEICGNTFDIKCRNIQACE